MPARCDRLAEGFVHNRSRSDARRTLNYCEASAGVRLGQRLFQATLTAVADLGVLLARQLAGLRPACGCSTLMAACGIRALRYGQEARPKRWWANDADPDGAGLASGQPGPCRLRLAHSVAGQQPFTAQTLPGRLP